MKFNWNPNLYDDKHDFVYKFGKEIINLLSPSKDEIILDLGCGTGDLTKTISDLCKKVIGIDNSVEMIQTAQEKYPDIKFLNVDIKDFKFDFCFDSVFSNAVLHWIPEAEIVIQNINRQLKIEGRFVTEFGGKGCVNNIISTLTDILDNNTVDYPKIKDSLYYPSIGEYSKLLEKNGFEVSLALLFDRPTELKGGLDGLKNFIEMFLNWLFINVSTQDKMKYIALAEEKLKIKHLKDTTWFADYRRIRIMAIKKKDLINEQNHKDWL